MSSFKLVDATPKLPEIKRAEPKPGDNVFFNGKKYKVCEGKRQRLEHYGSCWFGGEFCGFLNKTYICKLLRCYGVERHDKKDIYFIEA